MKQPFRHYPAVLFCGLCLLISGCMSTPAGNGFARLPDLLPGEPHAPSWLQEQVGCYTITTDTSREIASQAGQFMMRALQGYQQVTGLAVADNSAFKITLYGSKKSYQKQLRNQGISSRATGFYSPCAPQGIHVPWITQYGTHPYMTLIHEGVHQLSHHASIAGTPPIHTTHPNWLTILPLWLNEGLAVFMEGAIVTDQTLLPGQLQQDRLQHLQKILQKKKVDLQELVAKPYGKNLSNDEYSMAWGICFALYHGLDQEGQWSNKNQLPQLIQRLVTTGNTSPQQTWENEMAQVSLQAFVDQLAQSGGDLPTWQRQWQIAMLRLDANHPFGGISQN